MPYRTVSLAGETAQVDVATGTMTVQTPWGIVTAQAGDVLLPWGNGVVPMPSGLLDRLLAEPKKMDPPPPLPPAPPTGDPMGKPSLGEMSRGELMSLAAREFPGEADWRRMTEASLRIFLRDRGY